VSMKMSYPPPSPLTRLRHLWIFPIAENEIKAQGVTLWRHWRDPNRITERDKDADTECLPEVLPIMEILLESLYQCQRGLLQRGWDE
jgi:hypothetical protein